MKTEHEAAGNDFNYILVYLLEWATGIVYFITWGNKDKRMKLHSMQAVVLGAIGVVAGLLLIIPFAWILEVLIWLYGLYVGYKASLNDDVDIPLVTNFVKQYV